jgi:tetratricopeptide (TPR) repeat protein
MTATATSRRNGPPTTVEQWFGPVRRGFQTYGPAIHAARSDQADAAALLGVIVGDQAAPAVARASALSELASWVSPTNIGAAQAGLQDPDPIVRIGALDMLEADPASQVWRFVSPLLSDPVRGVRIRAAALLAGVPTTSQPPPDRAFFDRAAAEFIAAQRGNAERPEGRAALGSFFARRGLTKEAEAEYQTALRLSPQYATAAINLADLYRQLERDADGEATLRTALAASPRDASLHHTIGLTLTRLKRPAEALVAFRQASQLDPDSDRYAHVYAIALHSGGQRDEAIRVLKDGLDRHAGNPEILLALVSFSRQAGDTSAALGYAERLALAKPNDVGVRRLIEELRRAAKP